MEIKNRHTNDVIATGDTSKETASMTKTKFALVG